MSDTILKELEQWLGILDEASYYELLGVLEIESDEGIRRAFHDFSENFHPDRHRGASAAVREASAKIFRRGTEAYGVLRDPDLRAAYDIGLSQGRLRYQPGQKAGHVPTSGLRSIVDLAEIAQSKAAKLHAKQVERALVERDWAHAEELLRKAILADEGSSALRDYGEELIDRVRQGRIVPQD